MISRSFGMAIAVTGVLWPMLAMAGIYERRTGKIQVPSFTRILPKGRVVTSFTIEVDCAGVQSVEHLPDGWGASITPEGEDTMVRVARSDTESWLAKLEIADRNASNQELEAIRIRMICRSLWSDCRGVKARIEVEFPSSGGRWKKSMIRLAESYGDGEIARAPQWVIEPTTSAQAPNP